MTSANAFEDPLRAADLLFFTRVEFEHGLDVLADLVALGFVWGAPGVRRRRRQNGRFGPHQGMLRNVAGKRFQAAPVPHAFNTSGSGWTRRPPRRVELRAWFSELTAGRDPLYKGDMSTTVTIVVDPMQRAMKNCSMIKLTWLPHWKAYSIRVNGQILGQVRCKLPLPFRAPVEFV